MKNYSRLGALMGAKPELAIFRRYSKLNMQSLLYMQAEINELETELQEIASEDHRSGDPEKQKYPREWRRLAGAVGGRSLQWNKWLELRAKLHEYSAQRESSFSVAETYYCLDTALLQGEQVLKMNHLIDQDLAFFREWLARPKAGDNFLRGLEASIWDSQNTEDLAVLSTQTGETDVSTMWLANSFLARFHRSIGYQIIRNRSKDEEAGFTEYSDQKLKGFSEIVGTLLSSIIPITATITLYFVERMPIRLAMVAVYMVIFGGVLGVFTNARRVEIFAATAA